MNYYLIAILILISSFIFYCHVYKFLKINDQYQIAQFSSPDVDLFERTLDQKLPTFMMEVIPTWSGINMINPDYLKASPNFLNDKIVRKLLDKFTKPYGLPLEITHKYSYMHGQPGQTTTLKKQLNHRELICQLHGKRRISLFAPKEEKYLYPKKQKSSESQIDFFEIQKEDSQLHKQFPNFVKAKYIEVILSAGQIFYIPHRWWYASQNTEESISISIISESPFSKLI